MDKDSLPYLINWRRLAFFLTVMCANCLLNGVANGATSIERSDQCSRFFSTNQSVFYRGLSEKGLDGFRFIKYLLGDPTYGVRSWFFSDVLNRELNAGATLEQALLKAEVETQDSISTQIRSEGADSFIGKEARNAAVDRKYEIKRTVRSVFFGTQDWKAGAIFYAEDNASRRIENGESNVTGLLLEIREQTAGFRFGADEYLVPAQLRPEAVSGFFIAIPVINYRHPHRPEGFRWYYVNVARDDRGQITMFTVYAAEKYEHLGNQGQKQRDLRPVSQLGELIPGSGFTPEAIRMLTGIDDLGFLIEAVIH